MLQGATSLLEELRWLEYAQRLRDRRRNRVVTPEKPAVGDVLYRQALAGGAAACGVTIGALAPGYRADWLVLEDNAWLHGLPDRALLNRWLFAGERQQIHDVWVAGKQVIHQGRHALDDESDRQFATVMDALGSL